MADSCEMMLRDAKLPEIMAKENPGLYEQIREWIANFAEKLRKAFTGVEARHEEARAMMQYAEEMQQIWDNALAGAVRNTEAANGTETVGENVKYSYRGTRDGGVEVYETSAETRALSDSEKKKKYMQMMREQYSGRTAKFEHDGEVDYARFTGDDMRKDMYGDQRSDVRGQKAKLNVVADGDIFTLVENASYSGSEAEQGKDTKAHRNVISWDYYVKTVQIDGRMYDVLANIRKTADDSYVYSIQMNTRKTKEAALPRKAQSPEGKSFQKRARATSTESIPQSGEESNTKFFMRERDEDLQKKYPRLNLNEDISELDSVPAIELTDGSILPIKDRERYRTHVSFIEGNRIDVDDLRSGGWIGNGVYDASFTSDTARYIEQQQAKKRVAELRGVPYDQFGDGNTRYSMREQDDRQAAIQRELNQLKGEKKDLLNANAEYAAAVEQRRYAETFTERVAASKALKAAEAKVDTAEIDARIEMLQNEGAELREQERAEYNAAKEKYSGAKTKGYSQYADTRTRELDEEYSRAVTARDETKMQELVLEAAERAMPNSVIRDENGKLKSVYHYTNNNFTVFDRSRARTGNEMDGFFFAPDPESTTEYGKRRVTAFLNITNPAYDPYLDRKHNDSGTLLREKLAYEGYDGVIRTEDGKAYEYMAFDPEQIKSAEAITYDDAGNVIPLSERFNSRSNDIRYSMRDVAADDTADERRGRGAWIKILKHIF